ncbi:MAG TPA: hypothetical protein VNH44_19665 [Micropepsaceae bacterium]|nr:hypothetical protein [Micropepsaceae bacterium]
MRWILPILIMTLSLAEASFAAPAPRDMLIVPGTRVGPVALGMNPTELAASVGVPGNTQKQGPDTIYSWGDLAAEISEKSPTVDLITVNDPRYETADHIRVGLALFTLMAVLGDPEKSTTAQGTQTLDYDGMTIIVRNNVVAQIRVRK